VIPVNEPVIGPAEIAYVNECLETGWISSAGRFI
jgi:dTDP-4-amino-4,6-dideoxygalactose transaminase